MENEEQKALASITASNRQYRRLLGAQRSYDNLLPLEDECSEADKHNWKMVRESDDGTQLWKCSKCGKEDIV